MEAGGGGRKIAEVQGHPGLHRKRNEGGKKEKWGQKKREREAERGSIITCSTLSWLRIWAMWLTLKLTSLSEEK